MNALDVVENLLNTGVASYELKYCLVDEQKRPYTIFGNYARPNHNEDFATLEELASADNLYSYKGVGISISASNICAIDIDHCFKEPFNFDSIDIRGKDIYDMFKDLAYIEFSFSGSGMRILFRQDEIKDYSSIYYVKNSKNGIEYYQPSGNARYVTITGQVLANNSINTNSNFKETILKFLDKYMKRPVTKIEVNNSNCEVEDINVLLKRVRKFYFKDMMFQNLWFKQAPGSGKDESETDYAIISYLFKNVTQNKESIKCLFESSPYFKSKDYKHISKWNFNDYRYYNYIYNCITSGR